MAFRDNSPPAVTQPEREQLERICEALCGWIDGATDPTRPAAEVYRAMFEAPCDEAREAVLRACDDGLRAVQHRGDEAPLLALIGAVGALARPGAGAVDPGPVRARLDAAHGRIDESLADEGTAAARSALGDLHLGCRQLIGREPYFAWISFNSAALKWRGELRPGPPAPGPATVPSGCERCFGNPSILDGMHYEVHRSTARLVDESHLGVTLCECVHCGQKAVRVFEEDIDWAGGDDAQSLLMVALTDADVALLRESSADLLVALVRALGRDRARMSWDHPTGGSKTVRRTMPRPCPDCHERVIARDEPAPLGAVGKLFGLRRTWRCPACGARL